MLHHLHDVCCTTVACYRLWIVCEVAWPMSRLWPPWHTAQGCWLTGGSFSTPRSEHCQYHALERLCGHMSLRPGGRSAAFGSTLTAQHLALMSRAAVAGRVSLYGTAVHDCDCPMTASTLFVRVSPHLGIACRPAGVAQASRQPLIQPGPPEALQPAHSVIQQLFVTHDGHRAVGHH